MTSVRTPSSSERERSRHVNDGLLNDELVKKEPAMAAIV